MAYSVGVGVLGSVLYIYWDSRFQRVEVLKQRGVA